MHRLVIVSGSSILLVLAACSAKKPSAASSGPAPAVTDSADASTSQQALGNDACVAVIGYDKRCADTPEAQSDACANARKAGCDKSTLTMSVDYHAAAVKCFTTTVQCGDTDACVSAELAKAKPTDAMLKVRDDYCATCGDEAGPDCKNAFFKISADDGNGDGYMILQVSDDVARDIDAKCTGSALDIAGQGATNCREGFAGCAQGELENAAPALPDACSPPPPPDPPDQGDGG